MTEQRIDASKITKPIQLLGAWLAGLILVNGSFLATVTSLAATDWVRDALIFASILNVPLFLWCLFLLQTKFRPEMQEDAYYSKYLELNTGKMVSTSPAEVAIEQLRIELAESHHRNSALISNLDSGLKVLTLKLAETADQVVIEPSTRGELQAIARGFDATAKALGTRTERALERQATVQLNDLLPEYKSIRRELIRHRIMVSKTFGSTSINPEVPKYKIISFGPDVPIDELREIVAIGQKYGFDRINFTQHERNERGIYIGSYIYRAPEEPQPAILTAELLGVLNSRESKLEDVINEVQLAIL